MCYSGYPHSDLTWPPPHNMYDLMSMTFEPCTNLIIKLCSQNWKWSLKLSPPNRDMTLKKRFWKIIFEPCPLIWTSNTFARSIIIRKMETRMQSWECLTHDRKPSFERQENATKFKIWMSYQIIDGKTWHFLPGTGAQICHDCQGRWSIFSLEQCHCSSQLHYPERRRPTFLL